MNKENKKWTKKTKVTLLLVLTMVLLGSTGGYIMYSKTVNEQVMQTQAAYHAIVLPKTDTYTAEEKNEYDVILSEREQAFDAMDVISLGKIQEKMNALDKKVAVRIESERVAKLYEEKKAKIESITIVDGANETETSIFEGRKAEALQLVANKAEMTIIEAKIIELEQTNSDIENRKQDEPEVVSNTPVIYYDDSSPSGRSSNDGASNTGEGSGDGGNTPPPSTPPAATNPGNGYNPIGAEEGSCVGVPGPGGC